MPRVFQSLRLLPALLVLGMVVFGLRVHLVLAGESTAAPSLLGEPAAAAAGEGERKTPASDSMGATKTPAKAAPTGEGEAVGSKSSIPPAGTDVAASGAAAEADINAAAEATVPPATADVLPEEDTRDLTEFSSSELSLLQSLRKRREELAVREAALVERERMLKAFEQRLTDKVAELNTIKSEIESTRADMIVRAKAFEKNKDERIQSLVNVYEKMKPQDAARIFDNLNLNILLDVVRGMKEAKLAPVLAAMSPEKATLLTARLGAGLTLPALAEEAPASGGTAGTVVDAAAAGVSAAPSQPTNSRAAENPASPFADPASASPQDTSPNEAP
jgi:flagellar motility protein MotE (MotC chaperone)